MGLFRKLKTTIEDKILSLFQNRKITMKDMDDLYQLLVEFPKQPLTIDGNFPEKEIDAQLRKLLKLLNTTPGSKLTGSLTGGHSLLDALRLPINTLPYLYALLAFIQAQGLAESSSPLWFRVEEFILSFDPLQVRYAGHEFRRLLETIADSSKDAGVAIRLMQHGMTRLDPKTSTFTSTHLLFVRLCLRSRAWEDALPILDNDIYHIARSNSSPAERQNRAICSPKNAAPTFITHEAGFTQTLEYRDPLLYYLHGAMLYTGSGQWTRALTFLETAMVWPTANTASMIQVEAYKKWVLICLLEHGKVLPMPRGVNPNASKHFKALGRPYDALSDIFKGSDPQRLRAEADAGQKIWEQDSNTGLVLQVLSAHQRFAVYSLSKIYASIPLSSVYNLAFPPTSTHSEAYAYIADLIATGKLNATLHASSASEDPADAILRFNPPPTFNDGNLDKTEELLKRKARIDAITEEMRETRHRLEVSKQYTEALAKSRKTDAEGKAGGGGGGNSTAGTMGNGVEWMSKDEELLELA